jgi:hypothetical protein
MSRVDQEVMERWQLPVRAVNGIVVGNVTAPGAPAHHLWLRPQGFGIQRSSWWGQILGPDGTRPSTRADSAGQASINAQAQGGRNPAVAASFRIVGIYAPPAAGSDQRRSSLADAQQLMLKHRQVGAFRSNSKTPGRSKQCAPSWSACIPS